MKHEEITVINKSSNGYVKWGIFTWIMGGLIAFAGFAYALRVDSSDKQFDAEDAKIQAIVESLNRHIEIQNANDLKTASSLGRIEQALNIKK